MNKELIKRILTLGITYAIIGRICLLLVIPADIASPVWPSAGVAFAFVLTYGWRVWPGIVLGQVLTNFNILIDQNELFNIFQGFATAIGIGLGASLQSLVPNYFLKKWELDNLDDIFEDSWKLFKIAIYGGPLACLINSLWATSLLNVLGHVTKGHFFSHFYTWWSGDTLGVFVFTPITLLLILKDTRELKKSIYQVMFPLILVTTALAVSIHLFNSREMEKINRQFQYSSEKITYDLQQHLKSKVDILYQIVGFYNSSNFVNKDEFKRFTNVLLQRDKAINSLGWVPYITQEKRSEYEKNLHRLYDDVDSIKDFVPSGNYQRADKRPGYHTLTYLNSQDKENMNFIGLDLGNTEELSSILNSKDNSEHPNIIGPLELIKGYEGIFFLIPVYRNNKGSTKKILGHIIGMFHMEDLLQTIMNNRNIEPVSFYITDKDDQILYIGPSNELKEILDKKIPIKDKGLTKTILVNDYTLNWKLIFLYPKSKMVYQDSFIRWAILSIGVLLIGLVTMLLTLNFGHSQKIEHLVDIRTKQLERANETKNKFMANMSHEIRTPLNGIIGMADLMLDFKIEDQLREKLLSIKKCSNVLLNIVNDILDISKIENNKIELEKLPVNYNKIIHDTGKLFEGNFQNKNIDFQYEINKDLNQNIIGDPTRIKQILHNLIGNAIKFTENGSIFVKTNIETYNEDGSITICTTLEDTGIGIPLEQKNKIFEAFIQADISTTRKFGGTGLGLTIALGLAKVMGGNLWLKGVEGKGTTFYFTFISRFADTDGQFEDKLVHQDTSQSILNFRKDLNILVAEDNELNQIVATSFLKKLGLKTDLASNGKEALALAKGNNYDIIFMDCQMPEMDGFEATKKIRSLNQHNQNLIIIAVTASAMEADHQKCLEAGMDDFISKPIRKGNFRDILVKFFPEVKAA